MVKYLCTSYQISDRRACRTIRCVKATSQYRSRRDPCLALRQRLRQLTQARVRYGSRKMTVLRKREGWAVGKKLIYRLYREAGLALRPRGQRRRRAVMPRRESVRPHRPNEIWSMDFVTDQLVDGRQFRVLTVVDVLTRECVALAAGQRLRGDHVVGVLNQLKAHRRTPRILCCDHGSEFTGHVMDLWAYQHHVTIDFSRPGKPTDNAHVESFNSTFRRECLHTRWFTSIEDAKLQIEGWRHEYNVSRPHRALQDHTPTEFAKNHAENEEVKDGQSAGILTLPVA